MGQYMYPILIVEEHQTISEEKRVEVNLPITISELREHFDDFDEIYITPDEDDYSSGCVLETTYKRLETDAERDVRVASEKDYMLRYNKFHELRNAVEEQR